ncbi:HNH endonuclease [Streptomyces sp. NPDC101166]|uniref:HNH endonuclease n=1 Tax=Streptomyces sp. NPDC101166 TaxID=3366120 RepID=UPI0037F4BB3C
MTEPTCGVGDCARPVKVLSRRMCSMHHSRWLRSGSAGESSSRRQSNMGRPCSAESCTSAAKKRGMCRKHYRIALLAERPRCAVDGCRNPWELGELCGMHHYRKQQTGQFGGAERLVQRYAGQLCKVDGCRRVAQSRNYCRAHYDYNRKYGKPGSVFISCMTCSAVIDLRDGGAGRLRPNRPLMCSDCLALRPRGRWCMTTRELARRDGTDCSLCGCPVDLSVSWPDPFSPSVDHVIPRSLGGKDVPENVSLAHLRCNVSKGICATI